MGLLRPFFGVAGAVALCLTTAAPAVAGDSPPPPPPSIDQYVESVPSATGGASRAVTKPQRKPLAPAVARHLRNSGSAVAKDLKVIATSSVYGAPQRKLTLPARNSSGTPTGRGTTLSGSPLTAAVSAVSDSGDSHVYWLLGALIVITTLVVWAAGRRHRA
jgi:hypothetical protein